MRAHRVIPANTCKCIGRSFAAHVVLPCAVPMPSGRSDACAMSPCQGTFSSGLGSGSPAFRTADRYAYTWPTAFFRRAQSTWVHLYSGRPGGASPPKVVTKCKKRTVARIRRQGDPLGDRPDTALAMAVRGPGPGAPLRVRHPAGDPHRPRLPAAGVRDGRLRLVALASAEHPCHRHPRPRLPPGVSRRRCPGSTRRGIRACRHRRVVVLSHHWSGLAEQVRIERVRSSAVGVSSLSVSARPRKTCDSPFSSPLRYSWR